MADHIQVIQLDIDPKCIEALGSRERNQLVGCMHAHNELSVLNRIFMFAINGNVGGDNEHHLGMAAHDVQTWCLLQLLAGKLNETWTMINERFLRKIPEDVIIDKLAESHRASLAWLKDYFGFDLDKPRPSSIKTLRDKTAFHYDKLNLNEAFENLEQGEASVYLAKHPANSLYLMGSTAVFRTIFPMIADISRDTAGMSHSDRFGLGVKRAIVDVREVNYNIHQILYGLIGCLLDRAIGHPLSEMSQTRIPINGAPDSDQVLIPAFINLG